MSEAQTSRGTHVKAVAACGALWLLLWVASEVPAQENPQTAPGRAYLHAFRQHLDLAEKDLAHIADVAEGVADRFIERGRLDVSALREGFLDELRGRAGGLTSVVAWSPHLRARQDGLVLIALDSLVKPPEEHTESEGKSLGVSGPLVVVFSSRHHLAAVPNEKGNRPFEPSDFRGFIDNHVGQDEFTFTIRGEQGNESRKTALSAVVNTLNGWLFVGELTAACTRRGKMPNYWLRPTGNKIRPETSGLLECGDLSPHSKNSTLVEGLSARGHKGDDVWVFGVGWQVLGCPSGLPRL